MTTRALYSRPTGRFSRQMNLARSRDPGDLRADAVTLTSPAVGLAMNLSKFGIGGNGRGTYVYTATLTDANDGISERIFFQIDADSDDDRIYTRNPAATTGLTLVRFTATAAATANAGTLTDATETTLAVAVYGDGAVRMSMDGGVVVAIAGAPTTGLKTLRFGSNVAGSSLFIGSIASMVIQPGLVAADVELQRLSA